MRFFIFLLFPLSIFSKSTTLSWDEAQKRCNDSVKWGYYLQDLNTIKKLGGRVDNWSLKDLNGNFKTEEECSEAKSKLKNSYLTEDCQKFRNEKEDVLSLIYMAEAKLHLDKESHSILKVHFRTKVSCEEALKSGGKFKVDSSSIQIAALNSKAQTYFNSECREIKVYICKSGDLPIEYNDAN